MKIHLSIVDYAVVLAYFVLIIAIGWVIKRHLQKGSEFFLLARSLPAWIAGLAFLSANLSAQEVVGAAASGAKYGIMAAHFYWIGAIPAMVFLGVFMMPFYYGSKARSVPEYLKLRFDERTRAFNAVTFAMMTIVSAGISLHVLAQLLQLAVGWDYNWSIAIATFVVFIYIFLGGLTSAIYTETLQLLVVILGFAPLVFVALKDAGGWTALKHKLDLVAASQHFAPGTWTEAWRHMGSPADNPMGVGWFGMGMGLGFVLSFGYWCTDFSVVQRAMAAKSMSAARRTPLIAAVPKMLFPTLVILPGMIAIALDNTRPSGFLPLGTDGSPNYNLTIPTLLQQFSPTGLLGLGLTALIAAFMSGMAGNVTAFNTVWTYDIYQSYLARNKSDAHYLWMGRLATVGAILSSIAVAYLASSKFDNIMDMLQLLSAFVNAPLLATFLLGMFWRRATASGAFWGLLGGTATATIFHGLSLAKGTAIGVKGGWLAPKLIFFSEMGQNFWLAIVAWTSCFVLTVVISLLTKPGKTGDELSGLVYSLTPRQKAEPEPWYRRPLILGILILLAMVALNIAFR